MKSLVLLISTFLYLVYSLSCTECLITQNYKYLKILPRCKFFSQISDALEA